MIERTQNEVMQSWPKNWNTPVVTFRCLAYNHERFIEQTLDGFLKQETKYPFEIVIHDDASTDGTADIIRKYEEKYPKIIKAIYQTENQYSKGGSVGQIVDPLCRGKYIAYCEGDDYWTSPKKIEEQVDILEKNRDVFLVHTDFETVDEYGNFIERKRLRMFKSVSIRENGLVSLFEKNHIMTLTVVVRRKVLFSSLYQNSPCRFDYALFFTAAFMGKIRYIPKVMGAYRKHANSLMQSQNTSVVNKMKRLYLYYADYYFDKDHLLSKKEILSINYSIIKHILMYRNFRYLERAVLHTPFLLFLLPIAFFHLILLRLKR